MNRGVIYYNNGTCCTVRLLVSLFSLREHYDGPVTVLSHGTKSHPICAKICAALGAEYRPWDPEIPAGAHTINLAKPLYHTASRYDCTVCLDSDSLVIAPIDELFTMAREYEFVVANFAGWRSSTTVIADRIQGWRQYLPDFIEEALRFGPAINCGVIAFQKDAALLRDWYSFALRGRDTFIPDEVSCQIMLHRYPHLIADRAWNRSCRYDDPYKKGTRIVHYHGRRHCRPGLPFGAELWLEKMDQLLELNCAGIQEWMPAGDPVLKDFMKTRA